MVTLANGWQVGEPVNLGPPVNSQWKNSDPAVTPDGLTLLFASNRSESDGLWISTRASTDAPWGEPVRTELDIDEKVSRYGADISADGLNLLFAADRPGGLGDRDLLQATRAAADAPWGEPVNLGPVVNSNVMDVSPSLSDDGLTLLFASSRPAEVGSSIWMTTRSSIDDPWREPVQLPPAINSSLTEGGADLSSDGRAVVFESRRDGGVGAGDLWICTRSSVDGPWSEPVNLGPQVNTTTWDAAPAFAQNDTALYFSSRRPKGDGKEGGDIDIWMVPIKRPEARGGATPKAEHEEPPDRAIAPFEEDQAKAFQKAWADHLGRPVEMKNSIGMSFRLIPPGVYTMGSPEGEPGRQDNEPECRVTLTHPFCLGATEVTKAQFGQFVRETGYETTAEQNGFSYRWDLTLGEHVEKPSISWQNPNIKQVMHDYDRPVVDVTWLDAVAFCDWLSRKEGRTYRLPTEAEWEYACRAGTTTAYWFGDDPEQLSQFAWHKEDNLVAAVAVAQKPANPWGLYDMHGNASEWPLDVLGDDMPSSAIDPKGDVSPDIRMVRSGNFHHSGAMFRCASRISTGSMRRPRNETIGFRVLLEIAEESLPRASATEDAPNQSEPRAMPKQAVSEPPRLRRGLVAHWKLDGDAKDATENGLDGSISGEAAFVSGHVGSGALKLDGGHMGVPHHDRLNGGNPMSVTAWVNLPAGVDQGPWPPIINKGGPSWRLEISMSSDPGDFAFAIDDHAKLRAVRSREDAKYLDGGWHHLAGVLDGKTMTIYVDGKEEGRGSWSEPVVVNHNTDELRMGTRVDYPVRHVIGMIDDVRVYNRALTADEIKALATR